jgi:phospholipase/lecithinase/hemolysin
MSKFILSSPELTYSYKMSKAYESGNVPCANPNEHMFWDSIHPTEVIHMLLSQVVIETLDNQIFN